MAQYVLVNRRAGMFTAEQKTASRASVAAALTLVPDSTIVRDYAPEDPLARRVVVLDLSEAEHHDLASKIGPDSILEPLIRRHLHIHRPIEFRDSVVSASSARRALPNSYDTTITAAGAPLSGVEVMFYIRDNDAQLTTTTVTTDANGRAATNLNPGEVVSYVEPIPDAGFWIMFEGAPPSGATVDCLPIPKAGGDGLGWWHTVMNAGGAGGQPNGDNIRVGVIDTGCGPHPNLAQVNLAGVFVGGSSLPAAQATDVAQHGTHTSGIIGAQPHAPGDFSGYAPGCDLFHARVFQSEDQGPTQADLINAIDCLSRDNQCDLINMSLGGGPPSQAEEDCIRDALQRGTLCVCSAGNDGGPVNYPGAYAECVSVSAIGLIGWAPSGTFSYQNRPQDPTKLGSDNLFLASFSSNGPGLSAAGPGVGIISTVPDRGGAVGQYMEMDGTSMASPAVCGALAVILSRDAAYQALPRDSTRSAAARQALVNHCQSLGISTSFQGNGLPKI